MVVKIKKAKITKTCVTFENCKSCLEATKLENEINSLGKNKVNKDNLKES